MADLDTAIKRGAGARVPFPSLPRPMGSNADTISERGQLLGVYGVFVTAPAVAAPDPAPVGATYLQRDSVRVIMLDSDDDGETWRARKDPHPVTLTADGAALAQPGRLNGILIAPTGAVTPTVTVYDNIIGTGTKMLTVKLQSGAPLYFPFGAEGIHADTAIWVAADSWTTLVVTAYVS